MDPSVKKLSDLLDSTRDKIAASITVTVANLSKNEHCGHPSTL